MSGDVKRAKMNYEKNSHKIKSASYQTQKFVLTDK